MKKRPKAQPRDSVVESLSHSKIYQDYKRAFSGGTGLALDLCAPEAMGLIHRSSKEANPFCSLLAGTNVTCAACYALQQKLETEANLEPKTLKCFAGLCETAIPVRVGENLVAFLKTGQVLLHRPEQKEFNQIAKTLVSWGSQVDLKKAEEAYFNTRVLSPKQYASLIRLLTIFAEHLAASANQLLLTAGSTESPAISQARGYIAQNYEETIALPTVAKFVNMSASYFSERFKEATGLKFVDFVARTRIEKARTLLQDPKRRISEVAFDVGFQSLSQFNRAFKKIAGQSPREYRAQAPPI